MLQDLKSIYWATISSWTAKETVQLAQACLTAGVTFLGVLAAFGAFYLNLKRAKDDYEWRRAEASFEEIQKFDDSPGAKNAVLMLTWSEREIPLWAEGNPHRWVRLHPDFVAGALLPQSVLPLNFDPTRIAIQDSFIDFLSKFTKFEEMIRRGLLRQSDIQDHVVDWGEYSRASGRYDDSRDRLLRSFRIFAYWENQEWPEALFQRFKLSIYPTPKDWNSLENETANQIDWNVVKSRTRWKHDLNARHTAPPFAQSHPAPHPE